MRPGTIDLSSASVSNLVGYFLCHDAFTLNFIEDLPLKLLSEYG